MTKLTINLIFIMCAVGIAACTPTVDNSDEPSNNDPIPTAAPSIQPSESPVEELTAVPDPPLPTAEPIDEGYPAPPEDGSYPAVVDSAYPAQADLADVVPAPYPSDGEEDNPAPGIPESPSSPEEASVYAVRLDLANRVGLDENSAEIIVDEVRSVEWRDSSLGCPQPDFMYTQVLTSGYIITLTANGDTYTYHSGQNSRFVLCEINGEKLN